MTDDLDTLRTEVRKAWQRIVADEQRPADFECVQAELLRLAEDAAMFAHAVSLGQRYKQRAETAEAELAALKTRIAEAPSTQVSRMAAIGGGSYEWAGCRVPDTWNGKRVALVKVEE